MQAEYYHENSRRCYIYIKNSKIKQEGLTGQERERIDNTLTFTKTILYRVLK